MIAELKTTFLPQPNRVGQHGPIAPCVYSLRFFFVARRLAFFFFFRGVASARFAAIFAFRLLRRGPRRRLDSARSRTPRQLARADLSEGLVDRHRSHLAALISVNAVPDLGTPRGFAIGFEFGVIKTGKQFAR